MGHIYNHETYAFQSAYVIVNGKNLTSTIPPIVSFLHIFRRFLHIHLSNVRRNDNLHLISSLHTYAGTSFSHFVETDFTNKMIGVLVLTRVAYVK